MAPEKGSKATQAKPLSSKWKSKATQNTANSGQIKTKRPASSTSSTKQKEKRKRTYTDKELNLPTLNMITPAGVQKRRGKKKGKVFVDDADSMRTLLAMVSAEREGQIESKMQKARQMEEIREARRKEMERKEEEKRRKLEEVKDGLRRKKKGKGKPSEGRDVGGEQAGAVGGKRGRKRVSFGLDEEAV